MATSWLTAGKAKDIAGAKTIHYGASLDTYSAEMENYPVNPPFGTPDNLLGLC
jgi:hypothetical protein